MQIDHQSALAWLSAVFAGGWLASWLALRKDERAVQIEQVTKERAKWRESMRQLATAIAIAWESSKDISDCAKVAELRARLATSLNPKDETHDREILLHFDKLFSGKSDDFELFTRRMALLLKHDWERVKWECMPLYLKPFLYWTEKHSAWRSRTYRDV
jgi:spore maturation protein CgeB